MQGRVPPHVLIDMSRGVVQLDGKRLHHLLRDTRPWRVFVALASAADGRLDRESFFDLCPAKGDPKAAVCDAFRRLREALETDGVKAGHLIRRAGHGPWRLIARVTLRDDARSNSRREQRRRTAPQFRETEDSQARSPT